MPPITKQSSIRNHFTLTHGLLIACIVLLFQSVWILRPSMSPLMIADSDAPKPVYGLQAPWDPALNPLGIPPGQAENLPSIRVEDTALDAKRKDYGGAGDAVHLGGFTELDPHGISPGVWKHMMRKWGIHSVLDVGCGRGISTSWFYAHGLRTQCVEGSHDAVMRTMLPDPSLVVEHDFSRGPWWPGETFDAVWAVEFLEHVNVQFHYNYVTAFRKAAIVMVTSSQWGGWHHVEVHTDEWWIRKYESYGLRYDEALTNEIRGIAGAENRGALEDKLLPTGDKLNAQHVRLSMKVFINPAVAALPQHAHLFPEFGCFDGNGPGGIRDIKHRECGTGKWGYLETPWSPELYPLNTTVAQDEAWAKIIRANVKAKEEA